MRSLISLALAGGAFAIGLTTAALCVNRAASGGADRQEVVLRAAQALINGDVHTYTSLVLSADAPHGTDSVRTRSFWNCEIAEVRLLAGAQIESFVVAFRSPCGEFTRAVDCIRGSLAHRNERYYVASFEGC